MARRSIHSLVISSVLIEYSAFHVKLQILTLPAKQLSLPKRTLLDLVLRKIRAFSTTT